MISFTKAAMVTRRILTRDPASGSRIVMHRPNPQSGGQPSYVGIDKFLSGGASGPEHQALKCLIETGAHLATVLIACDVHPPKGEAYDALTTAIQTLGTSWWHHLETVWIVRCACTLDEIRDRLKSHIRMDDQLLVIDISSDAAGWVGVNEIGSKWLTDNI